MTVIELGELTRDDDREPPASPARLDRRLIRRVTVLVIAVLTVLGVTGSTPSVRHTVRPLWSTSFAENDSMTIDGDTLYAGQQRNGQVTLTAYDLATGRVRWAVPAGDATVSLPPVTAGVLVAPGTFDDARIAQNDGSFMVQTYPSSTIARDAATGHTLWQMPGDALATYPGSVLLGESNGNGRLNRLRVVGLRDGVTRWTRSVPGVDGWATADTADTPTRIVLSSPTGVLTVLNYADGTTVHTGRVRGQWPDTGTNGLYASLEVIGDRLVVSRADHDGNSSVVYRLDDFGEQWHTDGYVIDCGPVLCSIGHDGLVGLDPATGRPRWRRSDLGGVWPIGNGRVLGNGASTLGPYQLVDPATGRGVGDVVRGEPTWSGGPLTGSVLLVGVVAADAHKSSVIQLDLDTGVSYPLGTIDEVQHLGCLSATGYLVCAHLDSLDVTAVG
jgi:putative pyrroloquinoline-quinone binding quinoprotein